VRNHASTAALSRVLKHAELVFAETPDTTLELLRTRQADAMASARPLLLLYSDQMGGSRVLEDRYGALILAMAVRKDQPGLLAYISEFVRSVMNARRLIDPRSGSCPAEGGNEVRVRRRA